MIDNDKLNKEQRDAVEIVGGSVVVVAGAGTGKTRTIVYRTKRLLDVGVAPENILCVTFTNKAAREMRDRISSKMGKKKASAITICTIHSLCAKILREFIEVPGRDRSFSIYDSADQERLVRKALSDNGFDPKKNDPRILLFRISRVKNIYPPIGVDEINDPVFNLVYNSYQSALKTNNALDFDDLLVYTADTVNRKEAREKLSDRWQYIMVDEFQDTNSIQYLIIKRLVDKRKNLYVVGDDDQSIYGWRGAVIENITGFENDFKGAKVIKLEENYRCTGAILEAAGAVIENNTSRRPKKLWTRDERGASVGVLIATDEKEEARLVTDRILTEKKKNHYRFGDFAILYRTNAQSRPFEEKLVRLGIKYIMVGGSRFFERKEVKDMTAYFRVLHNPLDEEALERVINYPARGIGESTRNKIRAAALEKGGQIYVAYEDAAADESVPAKARAGLSRFFSVMNELKSLVANGKFDDAARRLPESTGIVAAIEKACPDRNDADRRIANVAEWVNAVCDYASSEPAPSIAGYLERVALMTEKEEETETELKDDSVVLMTIHSAKGLEFKEVFIVGAEEGYLPHDRSIEDGTVEEERRLFYVAMTRARLKLFLSYASARTRYAENLRRLPSRFISEIPEHLLRYDTDQEIEDFRKEVGKHIEEHSLSRLDRLFGI